MVNLSNKASGKRAERDRAMTEPSNLNSTAENSPGLDEGYGDGGEDAIPGIQTRRRRVLPIRAGRGGPGIGSCDTDLTILDSLKHASENEPLIPSKSIFILTTDSTSVPPLSSSALGINHRANEHYFDRPEVIKATKLQQDIQTPEFTQLPDSAMVGGRLRARGAAEKVDLSDAAYEKVHRKYEAFEKRTRLREKEKLQHEHYKLKERIEQLQGMDYSAFLALPATSFGKEVITSQEASTAAHHPTVSHANSTAVQEGERRRKLMLDVALGLEERYRTLLPEKKNMTVDKSGRTNRSGYSVSAERCVYEEAADLVVDEDDSETDAVIQPPKLKIKLRTPGTLPTPSTALTPVTRASRRRMTATPGTILDADVEILSRDIPSSATHETNALQEIAVAPEEIITPTAGPTSPQHEQMQIEKPESPGHSYQISHNTPENTETPSSIRHKRLRSATADEDSSAPQVIQSTSPAFDQPLSDPIVVTSPASPLHQGHDSSPSGRKQVLPVILIAASHNEGPGNPRKTSRTIMAFGVKVPSFVPVEFELPTWARVNQSTYEDKSSLMNTSPLRLDNQQELL